MSEHELARKVLIGVPTSGGCKQATEIWLLIQAQRSFRVIYGLGSLSVEDARTKVMASFLSVKDFTHLLFLDSDIVPPLDVIEKLYAHNKDIATACYPMYIQERIIASCYTLNEEERKYIPHSIKEKGLKEVDAVGLGCALIKREVLVQAAQYPCFQMRYGMEGGVFKMLDSDDITFSKVVKKLGFKIYHDFDQICDHYKMMSLLGMLEDVEKGILYEQ